jgi:predicted RNA-binding protein with PUA domain
VGSKRAHLMKRLFQFSNLTWRVSLKEEGPKLILEKGPMENIRDQIAD